MDDAARWPRLLAGTVVLAVALGGCKKPGSVAQELAQPIDTVEATGQAKCGVRKSSAKPLVIEWPAAERAALEARASQGLVAVRYEGCDMEVLSTCSVDGLYNYVGLTQKRESIKIANADELYAQLPLGAASLEGKLARTGQLNIDMAIVGRLEADTSQFSEAQMQGRCDEATHVVTGLTVGAFSFYAGTSADVAGGVKIGNIGAGAASSANREVLRQDGHGENCVAASSTDDAAPEGCAALLRVEVVPIDRTRPVVTAAPVQATPSTSSVGAPPPPAEAARLDRKIRNAGIITYSMLLLTTLAGLGGVVALTLQRSRADKLDEKDPGTDRRDAIAGLKTANGLMWAGFAAAGAFAVTTIVFGQQRKKLQRKRRGLSVGPAPQRAGAGLSLTGRFAP